MPRVSIMFIGIILMIVGVAVHSYSEDGANADGIITVQGDVDAIDWVGSVLMVNGMIFSVPSQAEVFKGADKVSFSDIDVGDSVTVTYVKEKNGSLKAVTIAVAYTGEFPT